MKTTNLTELCEEGEGQSAATDPLFCEKIPSPEYSQTDLNVGKDGHGGFVKHMEL